MNDDHKTPRQQRVVFGEAADLYDRARPGYPEQLVDDVLAFVGVDSPRVVEIGAGTGKATVAFATRGLEIVAIEPSAEMAAVARRNCALFSRVSLRMSDFEDWQNDSGSFDLLISGQAWHWVSPGVRYVKARRLLEPSGSLALFWNRPVWEHSAMRTAFDEVYRNFAPDLRAQEPGFPGLNPTKADVERASEFEESGLFGPVTRKTYRWSAGYGTEEYLELLQTQSNHRMLQPDHRDTLLREIAQVIDESGGSLGVNYATHLYLARCLG